MGEEMMNEENTVNDIRKKIAEKYQKYKDTPTFTVIVWLLSMTVTGIVLCYFRSAALEEYKHKIQSTRRVANTSARTNAQKASNTFVVKTEVQQVPNAVRGKIYGKYRPSVSISGELKKLESDIAVLPRSQQEGLRLAMEWLCRYEEFLRSVNDKISENSIKNQLRILQNKLEKTDMTAYKCAIFELGTSMEEDFQAGRKRNLNIIRKQLVSSYQEHIANKKNYQTGINLKLWNGWDHTKWSSDFYNTPSSFFSKSGINNATLFDPGTLIRIVYGRKIQKMTVCYQGYIYIVKTGNYKFEILHPSVPLNWSCGGYSLYIDEAEKVKLINSGYDPKNNAPKTFSLSLNKGFHSFTLINEVNLRRPKASHIQVAIYHPEYKTPRYLTMKDFYVTSVSSAGVKTQKIIHEAISRKNTTDNTGKNTMPAASENTSLKQSEQEKKEFNKLTKEKLEQRFWSIVGKMPEKIELRNVTVAPDSFPVIHGNALAMKINRVRVNRQNPIGKTIDALGQLAGTYKVHTVPYKVNLKAFFTKSNSRRNSLSVDRIMREKVLASEIGKNIIQGNTEQIEKIYELIFIPGTSEKTVSQKLDMLEQNIDNYNIARCVITVKLLSYTEDHKLVSQTKNKIKFEIHTSLQVEVSAYDRISKREKKFKYNLTTGTPGNMTFSNSRQSTAKIRFNRVPVFEISAEKFASLLTADLQKDDKK